MQRTATSLLALGLLAWVSPSQELPSFQDPESPHRTKPDVNRDAELAEQDPNWGAFLDRVGGHWVSRWNRATETPKAIYGTGLRLRWREDSEAEARRHAQGTLREFGALLRLGTSEFREVIAAKMGGTWVFVFDQHFRGLRVLEGRADVRIHETGVLSMFGSKAWPVPATFDVTPVLDEENARRVAWQALGEAPNTKPVVGAGAPRERLVIWGDVESPALAPFHLAWEVPVSALAADGSGPLGRYYVDAKTGAILHYENDKHECFDSACSHPHHPGIEPELEGPPAVISGNVLGWTNVTTSGIGSLSNVPLPGLQISIPGVGTVTTDANGDFSINSSLTNPLNVTVRLSGVHIGALSGSSAPSQTLSVTPGTPAQFQLLTASATEYQRAHTNVYWWVHDVNEYLRTIVGNSSQMAGLDTINANVNINENCNAFYGGNSINFYTSGGGCSNTAFSTVVTHEWGHGLDSRYGNISTTNGLSEGWADVVAMYHTNQPVVGSGFSTSGGAIRTGLNTRTYPNGTSVHRRGESWMGCSWDLRTRMTQTRGAAYAVAVTDDIFLGSIVADATNQPDAMREVFIADDDNGNLLDGTPHYDELSWAATNRNIPFPERQLAVIAHAGLGATTEQLTPRMVTATVQSVTGSFTAVRLHTTIAGANSSRPMVPTGNAGEFMALIPGARSPEQVAYHIEVDHSTNTVVRLPRTGEFSYSVGQETIVFSDDFEQSRGWTSAQVATQNDWQQGAPHGQAGDPAAAFSGTSVRANDLGASGWNGEYAANVENYTRTPLLNFTGLTGVTLRMKRWLTVEESRYDQATIRINGVQQWVNPFSGHLLDTAWTDFELPLPAADNNPSAFLEFRMRSDGGLEFGGWNIDDLELFSVTALPPPDAELQMLPEQAQLAAPMTLSIQGAPNAPALLILGNTAGPTTISGIPELGVGGNAITLPVWLDGSGDLQAAFSAPASPAAAGTFMYSQVLTLDTGGAIVVSNRFVNLFTN